MDDPTPAIKAFGYTALVAFPLSGFYLFYVFPLIDSSPLLVLTRTPTLIGIGMISLDPRYAGSAFMTLLAFLQHDAIQERVNINFAHYLNVNLSKFFGIFIAICVIRSIRVMSADTNARLLLSHTRESITRLARGHGDSESAAFASLMLDRLSLLAPRLAASQSDAGTGADAALAHFDMTVLKTLQETENALVLRVRDLDRNSALRQTRDGAAEAARQFAGVYRAGRLSDLDDLDAQTRQVAVDQVRRFLTLGGGWQQAPTSNTK